VDRQGDEHHQPLEPAEGTVDPLVVYLLALLEELFGKVLPFRLVRLVTTGSGVGWRNRQADRVVGLDRSILDDRVFRVAHRLPPPGPARPLRSLRLPRANEHRPRAS